MTHDYGQMRWLFLCSCRSHKHISGIFSSVWVRVHFVKCGVFNWIARHIQPYDFQKNVHVNLEWMWVCVWELRKKPYTQRMINRCDQNYTSHLMRSITFSKFCVVTMNLISFLIDLKYTKWRKGEHDSISHRTVLNKCSTIGKNRNIQSEWNN